MNIIVRVLLYLVHTWNEYIETTQQNRYGSRKLQLPRTELYVIYTGDRKSRPEWISLSDEFFDGSSEFLDIKVKVLYGEWKKDIISQYVDFTKVYNSQVKLYGRIRKAVVETIRICKDRDVLREYLADHEKEVVDIMMALFDQQKVMEQYINDVARERELKGMLEAKKEAAFNMKAEGFEEGMIAKVLGVETEIVQGWFAGSAAARP